MKALIVFCIFIVASLSVSAQFTVDAGNNIKACHYDSVRLGGHPSASGGTEPYIYGWKCRFYNPVDSYPIWKILNDPASPNPVINPNCWFLNDTIEFYLTVTDSGQNILKDSVNVIVSTFTILTMENGVTIKIGDSAQISPRNIGGGISPFTYMWTPSAGLSDPFIEKPWAKPPVSTSYSVKVTDTIGCSAIDYCWVEVETTGINETETNKGSSVYPAPVNFRSVIHINYPDFTGLTIKVFGQNGNLLLSDRFYQDYRIGEKIETHGTYYYMIFKGKNPVSGGEIIKL